METSLKSSQQQNEDAVTFFEQKVEEYRQKFEEYQRELLELRQGTLSTLASTYSIVAGQSLRSNGLSQLLTLVFVIATFAGLTYLVRRQN